MASRRRDYGSFSPRLQELSAKTTPTDPYQVTDTITIEPPGKRRRDELNDAYARIMAASTKTNAMLRRSDPLPNPPTAPEPLPDDATDEQRAEFDELTAKYEALVETYNGEIRAWNERQDNFDEMAAQVAAESKAASEQYNRALLGPAYDDIVAISEDWAPREPRWGNPAEVSVDAVHIDRVDLAPHPRYPAISAWLSCASRRSSSWNTFGISIPLKV